MGQVSSATKVTGPKSKDDLKQRLKSKFERRQKEVLSEDGIVEPVAPSNHSASSVADNMVRISHACSTELPRNFIYIYLSICATDC